jgi:5-methylthioadenosine/S-adenosylhomocysteine deaminase
MPTCDLLLTARWLLTQDDARREIEHAALAVKDGLVAAVGPAVDLERDWRPAERLDLGHCLVMPGLVNGHTHAAMSIFRGMADDLPLMEWLTRHIWPVEKDLTPEIVHLGAMLACAEMIRTGTTCFADMYLIEAETAKAVDISGLRGLLAEGIFAFPSPAYTDLAAGYALIEELFERYRGHPRIRFAIAPHAVYTTTPEILAQAFALAEKHDVPFMLHLGETAQESRDCLEKTGHRPLAYLDGLGCLAARTVLFHAVDLHPEELERVAAAKAKIVHNPQSNMKLASGVAPVAAMLQAGVSVGLGTDGAASNNDLNMFSEMTSAALLAKVSGLDPTLLPARDVLDMATRGGAEAFAWPALGSLAPGQAADLIALDLAAPNLTPLYHPASHLVYAASGHEVRLTMVGGRVLYRDGGFTGFDYPALLAEIEKLRRWVAGRNGLAS